jgi:hypothetical protein
MPEHSRIQPFAYQAQNRSVAYPAAQHFAKSLVVNRVKILARDVRELIEGR